MLINLTSGSSNLNLLRQDCNWTAHLELDSIVLLVDPASILSVSARCVGRDLFGGWWVQEDFIKSLEDECLISQDRVREASDPQNVPTRGYLLDRGNWRRLDLASDEWVLRRHTRNGVDDTLGRERARQRIILDRCLLQADCFSA